MAKRTPRAEASEVTAGAPAPARTRARTGKAASQAKLAPQVARSADPSASEPSEDDIRTRAYHLYLERGGRHGAHEDDWYRAEQELKNRNR